MCHKKAKFEHSRTSPRRDYIIHNYGNLSIQTPIRISMGKEGNVACPSLYFYSAPFLFIQHTPFSGRRVSALCLARSQTSQVPQALTVSAPSPLSVVPSSADVQHPSPSAFALAYP